MVRRSPRFHRLAIDPEGRFLAAAGDIATGPGATSELGVTLVPLDGGDPVGLAGSEDWPAFDVAIDPEGRRVAAGAYMSPEVRIWELESGAMSRFELEDPPWPGGTMLPCVWRVQYLPDGRLLLSTLAGSLWRLDPATGETELVHDEVQGFDLSADGRFLLSSFKGRVAFHDLLERKVRALASHSDASHDSDDWTAVALDPSGTIAISANNRPEAGRLGVVRVGPVTGGEPHLLFGPPSQVWALAVSPDGGTIAAATEDGTIRSGPCRTCRRAGDADVAPQRVAVPTRRAPPMPGSCVTMALRGLPGSVGPPSPAGRPTRTTEGKIASPPRPPRDAAGLRQRLGARPMPHETFPGSAPLSC